MELTNILKRFLMNGVPKMVVKMSSRAKKYETLDIMKEADIYIAASLKMDTFNAYRYTFDANTLISVGIFDRRERQRILMKPSLIEQEYRHLIPAILEHEREKTIKNYVEKNDYYRMLNGQPALNDREVIYLDIDVLDKYGYTEAVMI